LIGCLSIYLIVPQFQLDKTDRQTGYICSFVVGVVIWFINKYKWLPLPDGTHFHINREETAVTDIAFLKNSDAPQTYTVEFRNSKSEKGLVLLCGLVILIYGLYIFSSTSVIFPLMICCCGLLLIVPGYKGFVDRSPKLKMSEKGLWTPELGFRSWGSIAKAKIEKETTGRITEVFLVIYLKNGKFEDGAYPDQKLSLTGIKDKDTIEDFSHN
jgi:hypothetical protein